MFSLWGEVILTSPIPAASEDLLQGLAEGLVEAARKPAVYTCCAAGFGVTATNSVGCIAVCCDCIAAC